MLVYVVAALAVVSLVLHLPWIQDKIRKSPNKVDDFFLDNVDQAKTALEKKA